MNCPKCGGHIPFYDIRPNCKHCGVNIWYYSQQTQLTRDAKRTELEGAAARMVIARVKAAFIGSKLAIARLVITLGAIAVLLLPFGSVRLIAFRRAARRHHRLYRQIADESARLP